MSEVDWLDIFADNLRDIMRENEYSIYKLSKLSGISRTTIGRYLKKKQMPTVKAIVNLSYTLGCDPADLLDFGDTIE